MEEHKVGHKDMSEFATASNTLLEQIGYVHGDVDYCNGIGIEQFKVRVQLL